jgi:hypothetical protein
MATRTRADVDIHYRQVPNDYPAQLVLGGDGEQILNITYSEGCVFDFFIRLSSCLPSPDISLL